jgi:hypothetical protein
VVLCDVLVTGLDQVAVQAGDIGIGMPALGPVRKNTGRCDAVAFDTCLGFRRDTALDAVLLDLGKIGAAKTIRPTLSKPMVKKSNVLLMGPAPFNRFIFVMVDESFLKIPKDRSKAV